VFKLEVVINKYNVTDCDKFGVTKEIIRRRLDILMEILVISE
jgi:hypothetical protein